MSPRLRGVGQSTLEFAIVVPLFLLLLVGIVDFSRLLFSYVSLTNGARELARSVTITTNQMSTVVGAFNNLTILAGPISPASSVTLRPATGSGSGSITCSGTSDVLCSIQVTTGPSTNSSTCTSGTVCLKGISGASGTAIYTSSNFNYSFDPIANANANGSATDFVMLTWLARDQNSLQQGYLVVCRLPFTTACVFPPGLDRRLNSDGHVQVDARYAFQYNPLFQNRLAGVVDVSFMRPSTLLTTSVRTYAE